MTRLLLFLHVALAATAVLPMFSGDGFCVFTGHSMTPLGELVRSGRPGFALKSVLAAGLPALLAALNLPFLRRRRWAALSSLVLGLLAASLMAQLLARYGEGRRWGAWAAWGVAMALVVAGAVATSRATACPRCGEEAPA